MDVSRYSYVNEYILIAYAMFYLKYTKHVCYPEIPEISVLIWSSIKWKVNNKFKIVIVVYVHPIL